jgi:hypothetical protein
MARETFISTDVEADGPIPGPHSMLSFASVAFDEDGREIGAFSRNLELLEGARGHPETMAWWATQEAAWAACRQDPAPPAAALTEYVSWLESLPGRPVFVAYPAGFDFTFVYWYLMRFVGRSPFSHSALDVKTFAMCLLRSRYRDATKRHMPRRWFPPMKHTHVALDDAREQGMLFLAMWRESRLNRPIGGDGGAGRGPGST